MVELAFERIAGPRSRKTIAFLHGILGSGQNLRTIARRFVDARPSWTACLVDLRGHGRSPKGTPDPSLEAAARDVVELAARTTPPLVAITGHSFGGKVSLDALRIGIGSLEHVVTIDSAPGAGEPLRGGGSALAVIEMLESLPRAFASKLAFVEAVMGAGYERRLALWLALSLERSDGGVRFALDLREIRALLLDYFARDLWPVVEHPPGDTRVHLVVGERSSSYSGADRARARALAGDRVTVDLLPADHWVHVDDPEGLLRVMLDRIPG